MKGDIKIGRFFGIDLKLHFSWWLIALLLAWVLATNFFPTFYPELSTKQHWAVAIVSALLLFVSVILHELSHSFVARKKGIHVHSITLFFFGGVADIESENMKPMDEFLMAIAGPLFSFFLAGVFALIFQNTTNSLFINAISFYLFQLNLVLGIFNMVPGYPLDGGRAFRAILHWYYKDLRKATRIASYVGKFFALFLIFSGIVQVITGAFSGIWLILIGFFLHFVAGLSYEQVIFYDVLSRWEVSKFQQKAKSSMMISGNINLKKFIQDNLANKHKLFIVKKGSSPDAIVDLTSLQSIRGADLEKFKISDIAIPLKKLGTLTPDQTAYTAFKKFLATKSHVLVVKKTLDSPKIEGLVFKEQVMNALVRRLKFGVDFPHSKLSGMNPVLTTQLAHQESLKQKKSKKGKTKNKVTKKKVTKKKLNSKKSSSKNSRIKRDTDILGLPKGLPVPKKPKK
ncbi:site-2 protease family protein [archaeon]|jgi:Zn-dependent protease|nr:site-2 protease family protein [archaeon]MBT6762366.1 site-2 protease family protein [archaeon]